MQRLTENHNRIVNLNDICTHKSVENQTDFVGLRYDAEKAKFFVEFPIGYHNYGLEDNTNLSEKEKDKILRKDILNLLQVLSHYPFNNQTKKADLLSSKSENELPVYAYLYVIQYYLKHGYYRQKENIYKIQKNGKISWYKTIKQISPKVAKNRAVYLDFVVKKENMTDDEILSVINKYCVYEAFKNVGCLFTSFIPKNPRIKCREKFFSAVLKNKISKTFNDKDRLLFLNMLEIIQFSSKKHDGSTFFYGTNEFHVVWEKMVDEKFGTALARLDKNNFHPHINWKLFKDNTYTQTPLIPDTIMIPDMAGNKIYILDSKYYKYAYTGQSSDQPLSESVPKQIVYGDRIKLRNKDKIVYNAFILPHDGSSVYFPNGFAFADWKEKEELLGLPHNRIQEIFVDTRELMYDHGKASEKELSELAKMIEEGCEMSKSWLEENV